MVCGDRIDKNGEDTYTGVSFLVFSCEPMQKIYQTLIIVLCGFFLSACDTEHIETSQELPIYTGEIVYASGTSIPWQYPKGYTWSCTGCEVVSGIVLETYFDMRMGHVAQYLPMEDDEYVNYRLDKYHGGKRMK